MSVERNFALIINNNWEEVKAQVRHTWRKLTEDDVEKMNNYADLIAKLIEVYELTEEDITARVDMFIEKLGLEANLTYLQGIKESVRENATILKDKVMDNMNIDSLKRNAGDLQTEVTAYVKKNPLKSLAMGVLAVFAVKKLLTK